MANDNKKKPSSKPNNNTFQKSVNRRPAVVKPPAKPTPPAPKKKPKGK